ncbi:MAG: pyrroline-5-carboxylate reductase [Planctomycetaceae bacterium]
MTSPQSASLDLGRPAFVGRVGFLGTGKMATALAKGLIDSGFVLAHAVLGSDVVPEARRAFTDATQARTSEDNAEVVAADVVFFAVKPQQMPGLLKSLAGHADGSTLIVSIAAGVPIATITQALGEDARVVRVMPNTPCLVGSGASAYALGGAATSADGALVRTMLETVGIAIEVPEASLDAVTGLSGSGPAYVYQIIEALSDGGVRVGLPRNVATQLAAQTVLGAAQMVLETGEHPGTLKDAVTSPGGTTIAGLHELERGGLRAALMNAVEAATQRSRELGR